VTERPGRAESRDCIVPSLIRHLPEGSWVSGGGMHTPSSRCRYGGHLTSCLWRLHSPVAEAADTASPQVRIGFDTATASCGRRRLRAAGCRRWPRTTRCAPRCWTDATRTDARRRRRRRRRREAGPPTAWRCAWVHARRPVPRSAGPPAVGGPLPPKLAAPAAAVQLGRVRAPCTDTQFRALRADEGGRVVHSFFDRVGVPTLIRHHPQPGVVAERGCTHTPARGATTGISMGGISIGCKLTAPSFRAVLPTGAARAWCGRGRGGAQGPHAAAPCRVRWPRRVRARAAATRRQPGGGGRVSRGQTETP
jgi:hypothetical protein